MTTLTINNPLESTDALIRPLHQKLRTNGHSTDKLEIKEEMVITTLEDGKYRVSFTNQYAEAFIICTPQDGKYTTSEPELINYKEIPQAVLANTTPYDPNFE